MPEWALRPRKVRSTARLWIDAALDGALAVSEWIWVGLLLHGRAGRRRRGLSRDPRLARARVDWRSLRWILTASLILNLAGIGWGLPGTWVAIEMKPQYVFGALSQHFSHGWFDAYPPVHFYVLSVGVEPAAAARVPASPDLRRAVDLHAARRAVAAGQRRDGRRHRRGRLRLRHARVRPPRRTVRRGDRRADDAVSLLREDRERRRAVHVLVGAVDGVLPAAARDADALRDYVLFAARGMLSICTKDQAYGLYLLTPLVIVERLWREHRGAGEAERRWRARSPIAG